MWIWNTVRNHPFGGANPTHRNDVHGGWWMDIAWYSFVWKIGYTPKSYGLSPFAVLKWPFEGYVLLYLLFSDRPIYSKCVYSKLQLPDLKESYLRIEKEKTTISASFQRGRSEHVKIDRTINRHSPNGNVSGYCSQIKWLKSGFRILQIALAG